MKTIAAWRFPGLGKLVRLQALVMTIAIGISVTSFAANANVANEIRRYSSPSPTASFGVISDISSKYAAVLGVQSPSVFQAFIFDANTGAHLWTLSQSAPSGNVNFRFESVAVDGDLAVIGATYAHVPLPGGEVAYNAGAAFVYDLKTGLLKHKLVSNTPQDNVLFGDDVAILGNRIAVSGWTTAYVFEADSGVQLARLTPTSPSDVIGGSIALSENAIVVGANGDDSKGAFTGAAYAFDAETFEQITKFVPADAKANDNFGFDVAIDGDIAIASGLGGAYVFDATTGNQLLKPALGSVPSAAPLSVDIQGPLAYLSSPSSQNAAVVNWQTGATVHQLVRGIWSGSNEFGSSIAAAGKRVLVGAKGRAFQFQVPEPCGWTLLATGMLLTRRLRACRPRERKNLKSTV